MNKNEHILRWAEAHREEMINDLVTLCRIPSTAGEPEEHAPYGIGPKQALDKAMELCAGYGFSVRNHDDRVLSADLGNPEGRALVILAHLDVVAPGDGWDSDPFDPVLREDGYIYGRGVSDDKGGCVAALYAMRCVRELGLPLKRGCRLLLGTDEESGSSDVAHYYRTNAPAPNTFSPDAEFPVCNGEKGFYRLHFRKSWAPETGGCRVKSLSGGFRTNVVPSEARAELVGISPLHLMAGSAPLCAELGTVARTEETAEGARLIVTGHGCHAAMPEQGTNPITALIRVLTELPLTDCASTRALRELDRLLPHGDWLGNALGIAQEDHITGALTCSLTMLTMTETGLEGLCDCRVPVCATTENCKDVADQKLRMLGFEPAGMMIPPHYTSADTPFIRSLLDAYETCTGEPGKCYSMGGGTYVHDVPGGVAFGCQMPGTDVRMHGANERYPVKDLITSVQIFAHAIAEICG